MYKNNYNNRNEKIKSDLKFKFLSYAHVYNANFDAIKALECLNSHKSGAMENLV